MMTPEEIKERDARYAREAAVIRARHQRLVEAAAGNVPLLAVIDLHKPKITMGTWECEGCDFEGFEAESPRFPCRTIEALEKHYRLTGETILGELAPPGIGQA